MRDAFVTVLAVQVAIALVVAVAARSLPHPARAREAAERMPATRPAAEAA